MQEDSYAKSTVEKFLTAHNCDPLGVRNGYDVWIKDDIVIIQLPTGFGRIDLEIFEVIAVDQIGLSEWEFDYWLGQNGQ
jgi:hypothetical protein